MSSIKTWRAKAPITEIRVVSHSDLKSKETLEINPTSGGRVCFSMGEYIVSITPLEVRELADALSELAEQMLESPDELP